MAREVISCFEGCSMKILHVLGEMTKANGVATFVRGVCDGLAEREDVECAILTESDPMPETIDADIVHIHGLWRPYFHQIAKKAKRVVWSPHGMLQIWALRNKWWKKLAALALYQWRDLRKADLIHVTAESEAEDVRRLGLRNDMVVAPLGVRVAKVEKKGGGGQRKNLLFVSRVQRKKGLPNLLEAWARLPDELKKGWRVRIVGPDEDGHTGELIRQCERLGLSYSTQNVNSTQPQIEFVGPKYDAELEAEYNNADLFVLPTHSENFGSVVIEALAHDVPVICTKAAPWQELVTHNCGWWIDTGVEALTTTLQECLVLGNESLVAMGRRGHDLVARKYTWPAVAKTMIEGYERVLVGGR